MPALATVTISDGTPVTPVNHAFTPEGISTDGTARWVDRDHGTPVSFYTLSAKLRKPIAPSKGNAGSPVYRYNLKVAVPKTETVDGVPTKVGELTANVEFVFPETSTEQERVNMRYFIANLMYATSVAAQIDDLEQVW